MKSLLAKVESKLPGEGQMAGQDTGEPHSLCAASSLAPAASGSSSHLWVTRFLSCRSHA